MNTAYPFMALMEAVKLYLVASYTFLPLDKQLPLLPAWLTLLGALALNRMLRAAGGRLVYHVLAHALGCTACRGDYCCPVARRRGLVAANRPWDVRARGTLDRF